jgi:hypothetical protein
MQQGRLFDGNVIGYGNFAQLQLKLVNRHRSGCSVAMGGLQFEEMRSGSDLSSQIRGAAQRLGSGYASRVVEH